ILGRLGWVVSRSTLCDQIIACAGVLEPLYRLLCDRVRRSAALHADDTSVVLLAPRRTAHAWVYVGDAANPYTVFDLSVGRSGDAPAAFLKGYKGFVHADGYTGYNPVYAGGATHAGCMMHVRRYFFDARLNDPERAHEALARIRALYAAEQAIRPMAVGRRNWLHLGGDGGLKPTAVLLSIVASIKRQGINPWVYLKLVLTDLRRVRRARRPEAGSRRRRWQFRRVRSPED